MSSVDAVRRFPGLTREDVAHVTAIATDRVKPHLAAVIESGQLRKVSRTRGTVTIRPERVRGYNARGSTA